MPKITQIRIIAPSAPPQNSDWQEALEKIQKFLLNSWKVTGKISKNILGKDENFPSFANTDTLRFADLKDALYDPEVDVIWCLRGGYGVIRLIPELEKLAKPSKPKLVIGFSDITLLLIFLQQKWGWDVIHGPMAFQAAADKVAAEDLKVLHDLIFGKITQTTINDLLPLNDTAKKENEIKASIIGGNLTLISRTFGTTMQINCKNKILFFEDVEEPFRKIDGILEQLCLLKDFNDNLPAAIIIGGLSADKPEQMPQIEACLVRFAKIFDAKNIPVLRCPNIGHEKSNHPLPMGPSALLKLGEKLELTINSGKEKKNSYGSFDFTSQKPQQPDASTVTAEFKPFN